jgi:hypothetical protein
VSRSIHPDVNLEGEDIRSDCDGYTVMVVAP